MFGWIKTKKKREELNNIILNVKNDKKNQRKNKYTGLKSYKVGLVVRGERSEGGKGRGFDSPANN